MKVLLVGDYPEDAKIRTGVEGVLVNLTEGLIRKGHIDVVAVTLRQTKFLERYQDKAAIYTMPLRSSLFRARSLFREIVSKEQPDIIHLQGVVPGVFLLHTEFQDRFVVTQHAIFKEEKKWQVTQFRKLKFYAKEVMETYYLAKIRHIIFISRYNMRVSQENVKSLRSIHHGFIPNPVNPTYEICPDMSANLRTNELYFVGEIRKLKGLDVLIGALSRLKAQGLSFKLHVIGGFKESSYEKYILDLIHQKDLENEIIFCGWKQPEEIVTYVRDIPIFILPSLQETLPLSISEAMSMGKLVVASDVGGIPEMIEDRISGFLFPAGDDEALARILASVLLEKNNNNEIAVKALASSQKYKPDRVVEATIDFYNKVLEWRNGIRG